MNLDDWETTDRLWRDVVTGTSTLQAALASDGLTDGDRKRISRNVEQEAFDRQDLALDPEERLRYRRLQIEASQVMKCNNGYDKR